MKFMMKMAAYIWQDYRENEDILSELKINSVLNKIQNSSSSSSSSSSMY